MVSRSDQGLPDTMAFVLASKQRRARVVGVWSKLNVNVEVLDSIKSGGLGRVRTCDQSVMSRPLYH